LGVGNYEASFSKAGVSNTQVVNISLDELSEELCGGKHPSRWTFWIFDRKNGQGWSDLFGKDVLLCGTGPLRQARTGCWNRWRWLSR